MSYRLTDKRIRNLLIFMNFLLYLVLGLGRYNYSACIPAMLASSSITRIQAGAISTVGFFAYAAGNALGGLIADRIPPRRVILLAVLLSGFSNLVFFLTPSYSIMAGAWCLNGLAQGSVFCSCIRLINDFFQKEDVTLASMILQIAFSLGISLAYAVSAAVIQISAWRSVFLLSFFCSILFAAAWLLALRYIEHKRSPVPDASEPLIDLPSITAQQSSVPHLLLHAGLLFLPLALMAEGVLRDGVSTWGSTYVEEVFGLDTSLAVASNTIIPLVSSFGVFAANLLKPRFDRNELMTGAIFFVLSFFSMVLLLITAGRSLPAALALLAISAASMSAVNAMLINAVPLSFGAFGKSGAVSGLLNTFVYAGSGLSAYGIGAVVAAFGWPAANVFWLLSAALGSFICFLCAVHWRRFKGEHHLQ